MRYLIIAFLSFLTAASAAVAQSDYRIKSGDTLSIEVLEDSQLNRNVLVLPDGSFSFPFIGSVRASGRNTTQVAAAIRNGITSNFANEPNVFVTVASLRPVVQSAPAAPEEPETISIYFLGEVNTPGEREVDPGTTLLQAMSQAGGFTRFAATKRIQLRRTDASGTQTAGIINFRALQDGATLQSDFPLQDGDVILVPERRLFE